MTTTPINQGRRLSAVQVWGKGYRVTSDSEEFQRYVPYESPPAGLETTIASSQWGRILEPLYGLGAHELAGQRCILFDSLGLLAVSFAQTEDKHRRPSLVLTTANIEIDWNGEGLGEIAARSASLASRLSTAYAEAFKGNPDSIGQQLREKTFFQSRFFDLADEAEDKSVDWNLVFAAIKQWRGISGVATSRLLLMGANVMLGTRHEAERAQQQLSLDGYFDVREKEIRPLSTRLVRWQQAPSEEVLPPALAPPTPPNSPDLQMIATSIDRMERTFDRVEQNLRILANVARDILDLVLRDKRRR